MCIYVFMYIYICIYVYTDIYIYIRTLSDNVKKCKATIKITINKNRCKNYKMATRLERRVPFVPLRFLISHFYLFFFLLKFDRVVHQSFKYVINIILFVTDWHQSYRVWQETNAHFGLKLLTSVMERERKLIYSVHTRANIKGPEPLPSPSPPEKRGE